MLRSATKRDYAQHAFEEHAASKRCGQGDVRNSRVRTSHLLGRVELENPRKSRAPVANAPADLCRKLRWNADENTKEPGQPSGFLERRYDISFFGIL